MGEGSGFNAGLFYGRAAGAAAGAAQKKNASPTTHYEMEMDMDIPTHRPRLPGEIIPVKSSADKQITVLGSSSGWHSFLFESKFYAGTANI